MLGNGAEPVVQNQPVAPVFQGEVAPENEAVQLVPEGQRLPVRDPSEPPLASKAFEQNLAPAPVEQGQVATNIEAFPVRVQADSARDVVAANTPHAINITPEGDFWHNTVQALVAAEAINAMARELALQSQLVARDGGHWLLRVERESLNQPTARERLRSALEAAGHATQISVEVGHVIDSPARRNAAAAAERQRRAEEIVNNDPFVQSLMRDYGARIVPGSIKPA